jgi:flagellar biosynthesis protein FliR
MSFLETLITTQIFAFLIIFARIGCAFMVMPGLSDSTVAMNVRLYLALAFSLVLSPVLYRFLPPIPTDAVSFGLLVIKEMLIGLFIGLMSQIIINSLNVAGVIIAHITSLSSAFTFNPQQASQLTVISGFLSLLAVVLLFVSDLHHMLLLGLVDSYQLFDVKATPIWGDLVDTFSQGLNQSFHVGLMMAAPFLIVGFGVFVAMGLVARFVPQIQVFILSIPVQIMVGLIILMTSLSAVMMYFLQEYEGFWRNLLQV